MKHNGALKNRHLISNEMKWIQTQNWFTDPSLSSSHFFSHRSDSGCIDLCPLKKTGLYSRWYLVPLQLGTLCGGNKGDRSCRLSSISFNDSLTAREGNYIWIHHIMVRKICAGFFLSQITFQAVRSMNANTILGKGWRYHIINFI